MLRACERERERESKTQTHSAPSCLGTKDVRTVRIHDNSHHHHHHHCSFSQQLPSPSLPLPPQYFVRVRGCECVLSTQLRIRNECVPERGGRDCPGRRTTLPSPHNNNKKKQTSSECIRRSYAGKDGGHMQMTCPSNRAQVIHNVRQPTGVNVYRWGLTCFARGYFSAG